MTLKPEFPQAPFLDLVVVGYACEVTEEIVPLTRSDGYSLGNGMMCARMVLRVVASRAGSSYCRRCARRQGFFDVGEDGQDIMFGCAGDEAEDDEPRTRSMATWFLRHTQVVGLLCWTLEQVGGADAGSWTPWCQASKRI